MGIVESTACHKNGVLSDTEIVNSAIEVSGTTNVLRPERGSEKVTSSKDLESLKKKMFDQDVLFWVEEDGSWEVATTWDSVKVERILPQLMDVPLRSLVLRYCSATDKGLASISGHQSIETVELTVVSGISPKGYEFLQTLQRLQKLKLWPENGIDSIPIVEVVGNCRSLLELDASLKINSKQASRCLGQLHKLCWLNLHNCHLSSLEFINHLPDLNDVALSKNPLTNEDLLPIQTLLSLKQLVLSGTKITDDAGPILARLQNLETLLLDDTQVSNQIIGYLAQLPHLKFLRLWNTQVDGSSAGMFSKMSQLDDLTLPVDSLNDEQWNQLVNSLTSATHQTQINESARKS